MNRLVFAAGVAAGLTLAWVLPRASTRLLWRLAYGCWPDEGES